MSESLLLRELTLEDEGAYLKGLQNFEEVDTAWYIDMWIDGVSFKNLLLVQDEHKKKENIPETMLYAFVDGQIVGRSCIRHEFSDDLMQIGGHIGYIVAPGFRMHGYATEILKQSLKFCREKILLKKVLVTCDDNNIGSIKTIEKNGGSLENITTPTSKTTRTRRYWIDL